MRHLGMARALLLGPILAYAVAPSDVLATYSAEAHLTLHSLPGDPIGLGRDYDICYSSSSGDSVGVTIYRSLPDGSPTVLWFGGLQLDPIANSVDLMFGTDQLGIPIQAGTYGLPGNTAERAPFATPGHPGLEVSFDGRGSNTLSGNFTIHELSYFNDPNNGNALTVASFSASFEQHTNGSFPALFGTFTFRNLGVPSAVPEPASLALAGMGLIAATGSHLARSSRPRKVS